MCSQHVFYQHAKSYGNDLSLLLRLVDVGGLFEETVLFVSAGTSDGPVVRRLG